MRLVLLLAIVALAPAVQASPRERPARAALPSGSRRSAERPRQPPHAGAPRLGRAGQVTARALRAAPRVTRRILHLTFGDRLGKIALGFMGVSGLATLAGNTAAIPVVIASATLALVNLANNSTIVALARAQRASRARWEARWADEAADEEARWSAWRSADDGSATTARRPRPSSVARARAYFEVPDGLSASDEKAFVKRAYRKAAREIHPDAAIARGVSKADAERDFDELFGHYRALVPK